MNKAELVAAVAEKTGFTKKDAEVAIHAMVASIEDALVNGDKVQLIGFGTFETRERKARQGRNPRKPEEVIKIEASKAPVFKAGKALKGDIIHIEFGNSSVSARILEISESCKKEAATKMYEIIQ